MEGEGGHSCQSKGQRAAMEGEEGERSSSVCVSAPALPWEVRFSDIRGQQPSLAALYRGGSQSCLVRG